MNRIYCGVDFHARQQTICYLTTDDGVIQTVELKHSDKAQLKAFYSSLSGPVLVGLEASGYSLWFEEMLEELGHEVWLGDAAEIHRFAKRRQKNDRRDAELILDLLVHNEFPKIHRQSASSREVLRMLRFRHKLVKIRTIGKNSLQALSIQSGLSLRSSLFTKAGLEKLQSVKMSPVMQTVRDEWLSTLESLDRRITEADKWLSGQAAGDERIEILRTHPGIGLLSALAIVHTLDPVTRFSTGRKVAAYGGFDPQERSSAERKRYIGISKAGSRIMRFLLVEAAQTAVRGDVELRRFYLRVQHRRDRPKAKVAVARKLLIRSYIMLRDRIDYAEFLRRGVCRSSACPEEHQALSA